ncbi:CLUMA_CG015683, isoform A [Clunio marinus]|uniref:CLUMA_CG015683, isoform A n=1 Tax=Clunio marinus TaxID=568069 RepID=A0A1J1IQV8_9DIPT|nr:CLUMA_CG015683, isoform A [Clunio marinus]
MNQHKVYYDSLVYISFVFFVPFHLSSYIQNKTAHSTKCCCLIDASRIVVSLFIQTNNAETINSKPPKS